MVTRQLHRHRAAHRGRAPAALDRLGSDTTMPLIENGVRVSKCWDIAAVQRLLAGGWRMDPARAWALLHDLDGRPARHHTGRSVHGSGRRFASRRTDSCRRLRQAGVARSRLRVDDVRDCRAGQNSPRRRQICRSAHCKASAIGRRRCRQLGPNPQPNCCAPSCLRTVCPWIERWPKTSSRRSSGPARATSRRLQRCDAPETSKCCVTPPCHTATSAILHR